MHSKQNASYTSIICNVQVWKNCTKAVSNFVVLSIFVVFGSMSGWFADLFGTRAPFLATLNSVLFVQTVNSALPKSKSRFINDNIWERHHLGLY